MTFWTFPSNCSRASNSFSWSAQVGVNTAPKAHIPIKCVERIGPMLFLISEQRSLFTCVLASYLPADWFRWPKIDSITTSHTNWWGWRCKNLTWFSWLKHNDRIQQISTSPSTSSAARNTTSIRQYHLSCKHRHTRRWTVGHSISSLPPTSKTSLILEPSSTKRHRQESDEQWHLHLQQTSLSPSAYSCLCRHSSSYILKARYRKWLTDESDLHGLQAM